MGAADEVVSLTNAGLSGGIVKLPDGSPKPSEQPMGIGSTVYYLVSSIDEVRSLVFPTNQARVYRLTRRLKRMMELNSGCGADVDLPQVQCWRDMEERVLTIFSCGVDSRCERDHWDLSG